MLNEFGQEVPDSTPVVVRFRGRVISQFDQVRDFIRRELAQHRTGELETFEEANDFNVEDDPFPVPPEEYDQDTADADNEVLQAGDPRTSRTPQDNPDKPGVSNGGASSAAAVQAAAAPPAPSEPSAQ